MSRRATISTLIQHERRTVIATRVGITAVLALALMAGYAVYSGAVHEHQRVAEHAAFTEGIAKRQSGLRDQLVAIEGGEKAASPYAARPMRVSIAAVLPAGPLGHMAVGHGDLMPSTATVSPWTNAAKIFGNDTHDSPTSLASGPFDLAFVIVVLMPLFLLALTFNVLATDRERGMLAMLLSQPVTLTQIAWSRLLSRGVIVVAVVVGVSIVAAIATGAGAGGSAERWARLGLWLLTTAVYAAFWLAVIAFVVSRMWSASATALTLLVIWVAVVFVVPSGTRAVGEMLHPPPSRLAYLSSARHAENQANLAMSKLTQSYMSEHPELNVEDADVPAFFRRAFLANAEVDARTRAVLAQFEATHAAQQSMLDWAQYLSPAVIAQVALTHIAGSDVDRQLRYQRQTRELLDDLRAHIGPAVMGQRRLRVAEFDALPSMHWREGDTATIAGRLVLPLGYLTLLALICAVLGHRRLRRYRRDAG